MGCPLGPDMEPAAKKTSRRYGLPTLFQPGLPSLGSPHCAHEKPMWASSWAAHLGLTWSPRPKNIQPIWAAYIVPTWAAQSGQPSLCPQRTYWASSWAAHLGLTWSPRPKKHPAYIVPTWAAQS